MHLHVSPDEYGTKKMVHHADYKNAESENDDAFPKMSRYQHYHAGGPPDDGTADNRHNGRKYHNGSPHQWSLNAGEPEKQPSQRSLNAPDNQRHLQGGPRRLHKAFVENFFSLLPQRKHTHNFSKKLIAVANKVK